MNGAACANDPPPNSNVTILSADDTIAAVASPPGGAARDIVRLSGPAALACTGAVFRAADGRVLTEIRRPEAVPGELRLPGFASPCPATAWCWPGRRSYTRQPTVELHLVGSPPLVEATLAAVCAAGARLARPGEFTLRAFLAGRIDLTQAEAVLGVIDAADRRGLQVALQQLAGGLARPLAELRERLLELLAHLEAGLDFVEEDIEFIAADQLQRQLAAAADEVHRLAEQVQTRGASGAVPRVVLVGRPNVGKSSLFNALAGASALVSPIAGTTRDYLEAEVDLEGVRVRLCDTAGAGMTENRILAAAETQRRGQAEAAHLLLLCLEASTPPGAWEREQLADASPPRLVVLTKCDRLDLAASGGSRGLDPPYPPDAPCVRTSAVSGQGLGELRAALRGALVASQPTGEVVPSTAARSRESLRLAAESLARAGRLAEDNAGEELVAAEVRVALSALGEVTGAVYTEDLLDRIFSRFCIGK
jgi:tRNA modification GTPase